MRITKKALEAYSHEKTRKAFLTALDFSKKAQHTGLVGELLKMAWAHETNEGDTYEKRELTNWAQQNGVIGLLPEDAHGFMHTAMMPHDHGDGKGDHSHPIQKAFLAGVYQPIMVSKAVLNSDGSTTFEGWMTTEHRDQEKDIVPPECFIGCMDAYMANMAPLSSEHNTNHLPVGHLQQLALVRDGQIFKATNHPTDGHAFEYFPNEGTGAFCRGIVNVESEAHAVAKGNLGGMSWIGTVSKYDALPGGGKRYIEVERLYETTLAAYPVNSHAIVRVAKAYNLKAE